MDISFEAKKRFTEMRTAMLLHTPFFASLMLDTLDLRVGTFGHIPTAGTNGKIIWFDEKFLASLSLPEAVFICCHEIAHCMWLHMDRAKRYKDVGFEGDKFHPGVWNVACDLVINDMLSTSQCGTMPKGGLLDSAFNGGMLAEDVYKELMKKPPPPPQGGGGGGGDEGDPKPKDGEGEGGGDASNEGMGNRKPLDTHVYEPAQCTEAEMKRAIASAVNQAKAMGKMPGSLERWVANILTPQVNWREMLRHLITRAAERDTTTWASPHRRRLVTQKIYYPSYTGFGAGTIAWVVDTSGSMGEREFDAAYAEVADILTTCKPEKVFLMSCDARVHDVHELESYTDIYQMKPALRGGGGTSFEPAFEKIEEMGVEPVVMIYFTDGYGTFPKTPPDYPVVWVMTQDVVPPFGEVVKVKVAEYE